MQGVKKFNLQYVISPYDFENTDINPSLLVSTVSPWYSNQIYSLLTLLSYSQMWTWFDIHVLILPLQSHIFFLVVKNYIGISLTLFITLYICKHIYSEIVRFSYFSFISDCSHLGGHSPLWSSWFSWITYVKNWKSWHSALSSLIFLYDISG